MARRAILLSTVEDRFCERWNFIREDCIASFAEFTSKTRAYFSDEVTFSLISS
jgi:hypothetical protein